MTIIVKRALLFILFIVTFYAVIALPVHAEGIITTLAGNGIRGFSGDGGQATEAQLNRPSCLSVDSSGNIFIARTLTIIVSARWTR